MCFTYNGQFQLFLGDAAHRKIALPPAGIPFHLPGMNRLFLLDGMALVYRAHFAFITNPIRNSKGVNTSALYGFTNTLLQIIEKEKPTHLGVSFDTSAPTSRHILYPEYKAQRDAMPEELAAAIPEVKKLCRAFNIPLIIQDGFEADDLIGTLAKKAAATNSNNSNTNTNGQTTDNTVIENENARLRDREQALMDAARLCFVLFVVFCCFYNTFACIGNIIPACCRCHVSRYNFRISHIFYSFAIILLLYFRSRNCPTKTKI